MFNSIINHLDNLNNRMDLLIIHHKSKAVCFESWYGVTNMQTTINSHLGSLADAVANAPSSVTEARKCIKKIDEVDSKFVAATNRGPFRLIAVPDETDPKSHAYPYNPHLDMRGLQKLKGALRNMVVEDQVSQMHAILHTL